MAVSTLDGCLDEVEILEDGICEGIVNILEVVSGMVKAFQYVIEQAFWRVVEIQFDFASVHMKEGSENPQLVLETPGRSSIRRRKGKTYKYSSRKAQKAAEQRKKLRVLHGVSSSLLVGGPERNVTLEAVKEEEGSPSQFSREEVRNH